MKPTWVLSEEERQRRFKKNRDKHEQCETQTTKGGRSKGNSLDDLAGEFDLMDGANLTDTLPGLLLLEQAAEERARETVPIILEKHQQQQQQPQNIVVKNELGNQLHNGDVQKPKELKQLFCEPAITTNSFYVKTEPNIHFSTGQYLDQKPVDSFPNKVMGVPVSSQSSVLFVTSASQFPLVQQPTPSTSYMTCLSQSQLSRPQQQLQEQPRTVFLSSTPSVIVQATPSMPPRYQAPRYQAPSMEYAPESIFPLEVGSFATVGGVETVNSGQSYAQDPTICSLPNVIDTEEYQQQLEDVRSYVEEDEEYYTTTDDEEAEAEANAWREKILKEPEIILTEGEEHQLNKLVKQHDERYRSVNFGEELIKEMIMCSMFGIPVSTSAAITGYRLTVERITRIAHNLECFTDLPKCDQNALLKENADQLVSLRGAIFFDAKKKGVDQVLISMGVDDMETIKTMFTPLLKENSMKHIDYSTFNSIQVIASPATEARYNFLQTKVAAMVSDDVSIILIYYIILFSSDFCVLSNKYAVEQNQDHFIRMLHRYLYSRKPRHVACNIMASTLSSLTYIREMADIKKSRAINQNVRFQ